MVSDDALACLGIGMAVVCWGSYMAPVKLRAVVAVRLDALVFQLYMSLGIAMSSQALFLLPFVTPAWTSWALVAAALWVPASLLCIPCVRLVGIALGQGVWAGKSHPICPICHNPFSPCINATSPPGRRRRSDVLCLGSLLWC